MKKVKKLVCGFLAVAVLTGIGFNSYSSLNIDGVCAQRPTQEVVQDVSVYTDDYVPLLDTNGSEIAGYYSTVNGGYAVIENNGEVIEFDDDTPIDNIIKDEEMYYLGPTQIFKKKNDTLVSVHESTYEVAFEEVSETYSNFIAEAKKAEDEVVTASSEDSEYEETGDPQRTVAPGIWINLKGGYGNVLNKNTDALRTNRGRNGNCGPTAASIMLLYYDKYVNSKYVKNSYRKEAKWQEFTDILINYIQPNQVGSTMSDNVNGINKYLKSRKISPVCTYETETSDIKNILIKKIDANRPIMLGLIGHPTYNAHAVVAEGYFVQDSGNKYTYAAVNDGWGNCKGSKGKYLHVNVAYAEFAIYLN